jgi:hypothetical protein
VGRPGLAVGPDEYVTNVRRMTAALQRRSPRDNPGVTTQPLRGETRPEGPTDANRHRQEHRSLGSSDLGRGVSS